MGMSASQARFLMLTAQKNNNEFQAQRITHERLMLSQQTEDATKIYTDKINNSILLFRGFAMDGNPAAEVQLNYGHIVTPVPDGLGLRLVSGTHGRILSPDLESLSPEELARYNANPDAYLIDPDLLNADTLEQNLREGNYRMQRPNPQAEDGFEDVMIDGVALINDTFNTLDDAEAEATHKLALERFHSADKRLEMKLKQLDSEHKALETEMESVKKVVEKNIESTFKTFG